MSISQLYRKPILHLFPKVTFFQELFFAWEINKKKKLIETHGQRIHLVPIDGLLQAKG